MVEVLQGRSDGDQGGSVRPQYADGIPFLGASQIASAAGIGYDSRQKLYRKIRGIEPETPINPAMQYGIDHEADALAEYERATGMLIVSQQEWHRHPTMEFVGATIDGMTHDGLCVVEAKCPANLYPEPPIMYVAQCVTQRMCVDAMTAHLIAWTPTASRIWLIGENDEFADWLEYEARKFWAFVLAETEPPRQKKPTPPPIEYVLIFDSSQQEAA